MIDKDLIRNRIKLSITRALTDELSLEEAVDRIMIDVLLMVELCSRLQEEDNNAI